MVSLYKFYIAEVDVDRDQVDFARKLYIVGDYNYQESYGRVAPGDIIGADGYSEAPGSALPSGW